MAGVSTTIATVPSNATIPNSGIAADTGVYFGLAFDDDADNTVHKDVDAGPTELHAIQEESAHAAITYIHLWDKKSVVIGTDAQDFTIPVASAGNQFINFLYGAYFAEGLSWACTTDKGTTASTAPGTPTDLWVQTTGGVWRSLGNIITPGDIRGQGGAQIRSVASVRNSSDLFDPRGDQNARTASASAGTIYGVYVDNRLNSDSSYVKLYNNATPTIGTTDPDIILRAYKGYELLVTFSKGVAMSTAITYAVVTTGGTGGAAGPADAVGVRLWYS